MPWIGIKEGDRVGPEYVDDGEEVICPDCNGRMYPRGPYSDGRARHFWHTENLGGGGDSGNGTCVGEGGESDTHKKLKSFAVSRLRNLYDGEYEKAQPEFELGSNTDLPSGADKRVADAFLQFSEPSLKLGYGLIIEVQHRNEQKDIDAVEQDYLSLGYSVVWTNEDDYSGDRCKLGHPDIIERAVTVWPAMVPEQSEWQEDSFEDLDMQEFRKLHGRWFDPSDQYVGLRSVKTSEIPYGQAIETFGRSHFQSAPEIQARLPPDWIAQQRRKIFRQQDWQDLFDPSNVSDLIQQGYESTTSEPSKPQAKVAFHKFIAESSEVPTSLRWKIRQAWKSGYQESVPHKASSANRV